MSSEQLQASSPDVERIRDIIFGTQMRDYQERFEALRQDLAQLHQDIQHLTEQLAAQESSQGQKVEALGQEMRHVTDGLRNELRETTQRLSTEKVERTDLGHLLVQIGSHLTEGRSLGNLFENMVEAEQDS